MQEWNKFINIYHGQDFGLSAEWITFVTDHGNWQTDKSGEIVKLLTAKSSECNMWKTHSDTSRTIRLGQWQVEQYKVL
jgi:hypothetical protein